MSNNTESSIFNVFAKGSKTKLTLHGTNCVIYTRVSSREQADNLSLVTQLKGCNSYASKLNYNILACFGGTYESAENDERKEFKSMIDFVKKSKQSISYILVYSLERFSRNDNSIWLSGELRKLGIEIVSVTQPIDTSSASGQMQQKMLFLFGEFDNQLRKQKCTAGIKEMLFRGDWPTMPPLGYDSIRSNGRRKIVVNVKGKLLRQAFEWKAQEGLSNESIRVRLSQRGLKLNHQRISEIFRNPFYCGLMAHNMLEGKVVEGNHEKLVSRDLFLKVNGLLDNNAHGYNLVETNNNIPLKRFLFCDECGKPMRGYLVKKKNIHYYKCNTIGCGNNKNAEILNNTFANILEEFNLNVDADVVNLLRSQMIATFNHLTKGQNETYEVLQNKYHEVTQKVNRLEERYVEEEITSDLYNRFWSKYQVEMQEIEQELLKCTKQVSNLDECVDLAIKFASRMRLKWLSADYHTRQRIQFLLFPAGITYSKIKDKCRTTRINFLFSYIAYFQQNVSQKKGGIPDLSLDFASFADLVAGSRIELPTSGL